MSVTSGFFNSVNGDRRYYAKDMSAIFDGIINDGVFANIGTSFTVNANSGNTITVGIGRAWFNSTWIYNDAILPIEADISEVLLDRHDAVVIEVDHSEAVRNGSIKIIKGTPSSDPQRPAMANDKFIHQYPLAYIYRAARSTEITQSNITSMIGTSSCPYITGILQVQNIDNIVAQWSAQWDEWYANKTDEVDDWTSSKENEWTVWFQNYSAALNSWTVDKKSEWNTWFNNITAETTQWTDEKKAAFDSWFANIRGIVEGDALTALADRVLKIEDGTTPAGDANKLGGIAADEYLKNGENDIYPTKTGESIHLTDSSAEKLHGFKLFGKTTQDHEPSPDNPSPLESVGDGGVESYICGDNFLPYLDGTVVTVYGVTLSGSNGSYTLNGTCISSGNFTIAQNITLPKSVYTLSANNAKHNGLRVPICQLISGLNKEAVTCTDDTVNSVTTVLLKGGSDYYFRIRMEAGITYDNYVLKPVLNLGSEAIPYKPYTYQTMSFSTPNGLPGIEVTDSSLTNYTDENGKMWCCDEVDFARGVYVKRIGTKVLDSNSYIGLYRIPENTETYIGFETSLQTNAITNKRLSSHFIHHGYASSEGYYPNTFTINSLGWLYLRTEIAGVTDVPTLKSWLDAEKDNGNPVTFSFILATPIETPLTADEIVAYKSLHTNKPVTNIMTDSNAGLEISYLADTALYENQNGKPTAEEMYLGKGEVAQRAVEDALGRNIINTYVNEDEIAPYVYADDEEEEVTLTYPGTFKGAGAHNAIYRGYCLGTSVTTAQYAAIADGSFDDLYIGDYWTIGGVNYRIAAFDYYLNCGDTAGTKHHVVIVPDACLYNHVMNDTNITTGGYVGSKMYTEGLEQAKTTIKAAFSGHVLSHRVYLTNAVTDVHPSAGAWYDSEVDLMNEQMVYGGAIFMPIANGSTVYTNYRVEKSQLPLFAHEPSRICNRATWWLRDVVTASNFADVHYSGNADCADASTSRGVRPAFCISG